MVFVAHMTCILPSGEEGFVLRSGGVTHESSRSQGKGSRRFPGRPGGASKRKRQEWEKRATHMVESPGALPAQDAAANVQRIIDQLRPPTGRVRPVRFRGRWTDIEPARLSKAYQDHPWVFAVYRESASDRDDRQRYDAFLFRNKERTVFGIREWLGGEALVRYDVLQRMAHRIVTDSEYRRQFISEDPDLIDMWKRH
jgi:hypothetical protein